MLILTRKTNESIVIDGDIRVIVLGFERGRVKLGIVAPPEVSVLRSELVEETRPATLAETSV